MSGNATTKSERPALSAARPCPTPPLSRCPAIEEATRIARWVCQTGLVLDGGARTWFVGQYVPSWGRCRNDLANHSLFDGATGIALFLTALSRVSSDGEEFGEAARAAIASVEPESEDVGDLLATRREVDLGVGTGLGSTIYRLIHIAGLLGTPEHLDLAVRLSRLFDPEIVAKKHQLRHPQRCGRSSPRVLEALRGAPRLGAPAASGSHRLVSPRQASH